MKTTRLLTACFLLLLLAPAIPAVFAQEDPPAAAQPAPAPKKMTLWDLIKVGGWAMWPLGTCSFGMVALAVLNFRQVSRKKLMPQDTLAQIRAAADQQDLQKVFTLATGVKSLFTNALAAGLRHYNPEQPEASKPRVQETIAEAVAREESQVGFWINFLSLITAIAPMFGLLGTVSGMIGAFQKIGAGGMGKPELLASNIGEALVTTAAGLMIAIPSMFFYFLFRNMLSRILEQAEEQYSYILEGLTGTAVLTKDSFEPEAPAGT